MSYQNTERNFLGALILNPELGFDSVGEFNIKPEDFRQVGTRNLFLKVSEMKTAGDPITEQTVFSAMNSNAEVYEMTRGYPGEPSYFAKLMLAESKRLKTIETLEAMTATARDPEADLDQVIDKGLLELGQVRDKGSPVISETLAQAAARVIADLDTPPRYIPTPWGALNKVIGGLRPGSLHVIAARPGVGKSMFGLQLAQGVATPETQIALFSYEMTPYDQATRALSALTRIDSSKIDSRDLSPEERDKLEQAQKGLDSSFHLMGTNRQISHLRPAIRALQIQSGYKLAAVFIDYLGLIEDKGTKHVSVYEKVTAISGKLKGLALELDLPIVLLVQLNRTAQETDIPELSSLRDSGAIEQDADLVIGLSKRKSDLAALNVTILKNRRGTLAMFQARQDSATMRITEMIR